MTTRGEGGLEGNWDVNRRIVMVGRRPIEGVGLLPGLTKILQGAVEPRVNDRVSEIRT